MWTYLILMIISFGVAVITFPTLKRNRGKVFNYIVYLIACLLVGHFAGRLIAPTIPDGFTTEQTVKQYIVDNPEKFYHSNILIDEDGMAMRYKSNTCDISDYWEEVTIVYPVESDSMYVVVWGDRESWWWNVRSDKGFWIHNDGDELNSKVFNVINEL